MIFSKRNLADGAKDGVWKFKRMNILFDDPFVLEVFLPQPAMCRAKPIEALTVLVFLAPAEYSNK